MLTPLILCGPSGIGKSYLTKYLAQTQNCQQVLSTTTRIPRPHEANGIDYNFCTLTQYRQYEKENRFFMSNFFLENYYGLEFHAVNKIIRVNKTPVAEIHTPLALQFIKQYPHTQAIYLVPESIELLEQRLLQRGDTPQQRQIRLDSALEELEIANNFLRPTFQESFVITNNNMLEIAQEISNRFLRQKY